MQGVAQLAQHVHRYNSRIFVTMNTISRDDELEPARELTLQQIAVIDAALGLKDATLNPGRAILECLM